MKIMCDLNFLNLSEKIKKKLVDEELDTIEKISTQYLENARIKDINSVHDEIFRRHLCELGVIEETETLLNERDKSKSVSWEFSCKTVHSVSEPGNYLSENTSTYVSSSEETDFSFIVDSVEGSFNSFIDASVESFGSSGFNVLNKRRREYMLFAADKERILYKGKQNNVILEKKKEKESSNYLLIYSNFMKHNMTRRKIYRMESNSLNDLLSEGIESAKIYYFYGINLRTSRILLLNMLLDIVGKNNMEQKNVKGNVIYIYFGYKSDVKIIRDVVFRKVKNGLRKKHKTKKIGKRENTGHRLNDLLSRIYVLPIQDEKNIFTLLSNIRNNHQKGKERTENERKKEKGNEKEEKKGKGNKEKRYRDTQNILAIGILNFSELVLNLSLTNSCSYFYLVRELKVISHLLRIPILIFDELKSESAAQIFKSKKGEIENETGMENENEEDRLKNQLVINEMKKNILNAMSQYDEEEMLMEQKWEFGELDAFVEQEKDRIWGSVNGHIRTDEYSFSKNDIHMQPDSEHTKGESNGSISDSECENDSDRESENESENESGYTIENISDSENISGNESISDSESIGDSESISDSENINNNEYYNEESDDNKKCDDSSECMSNNSIESSGKGAHLLYTQNRVTKKSLHYEHMEIMKSTFANAEKTNVKQIFVPYGLCSIFDVILEVEVIKEGKIMKWNKQKEKQKIIRFTLLKSQYDSKHLYCHTLLKNDILCDL